MFKLIIYLQIFLSYSYLSINAQYKNVQITSPYSTMPEEVTIAVNPVNPLNLAAGANINNYYYSFDGGHTWSGNKLSSPLGVYGDPSLTFDFEGNLYFGHLSNPEQSGYWIDRIVVQKSNDGGVNWNNGVGIGYNPPLKNQDKEWLVSDHTNSAFRGNVYMAWTEFDKYGSKLPQDSTRILFSRSDDRAETWSSPVRVSDTGGNCIDSDSTVEGAVPAVGPDGDVYVSWSGPLGIMFDKSTDGGLTFGSDIFVTSQPGGWDFSVPGIFRCNGFPVTLCDISNSQYKGNIYINWSDQRNGADNTDVFLIKSTDEGNTWGEIKKVNNDDGSGHQFFSWAAIDPITGIIYIVFYDRRNYAGSALETDVFIAKSSDGGESFVNFKVSDSPFIPSSNVFIGDYNNIAAYNGRIYPIWTRMDNRKLSIWTALVEDTLTSVDEITVPQTGFELFQNYPNPFNPETTIKFTLSEPGGVRLILSDLLGRENILVNNWFNKGPHFFKFNFSNFPSGVYYYRLKSGNNSQVKKLIILK